MADKPSQTTDEQIQKLQVIFAEIFQQFIARPVRLEIKISFYPFAGLNHTIRLRNQTVYVRIADILQDAPAPVFVALAKILIGKLLKRRPNQAAEQLYQDYIYQPHITQASEQARKQRGRKQLRGSQGKYYDLAQIFRRLNRQYFEEQLPTPKLSWSQRPNKRILGHYDSIHNAIVISCSLDRQIVPTYVIDYVMYHEMLHIKHPTRVVNGMRRYHTTIFRQEEKLFHAYEPALAWLEHRANKR